MAPEFSPREKPAAAGFYPDDITKDEFNSWLAGLADSDKEKATGYFYAIRRNSSRKLTAVPYSQEYREFERMSTTVVNAYIGPKVGGYVKSLKSSLADIGFAGDLSIMRSNGGVMSAATAEDKPVRTLLSGEYDAREALITIRSGAGGVDAADFAEMLMRMYTRWAERNNYPVEVYDTSYAEEAGIKSAEFAIHEALARKKRRRRVLRTMTAPTLSRRQRRIQT